MFRQFIRAVLTQLLKGINMSDTPNDQQHFATTQDATGHNQTAGATAPDPNDLPDGALPAQYRTAAYAYFLEWQGNVLARLGMDRMGASVTRADNPVLFAALANIAAAGAPDPVVRTETVSAPDGSTWTLRTYTYGDINGGKHAPVVSNEFLLAACPSVVIAELRTAGIIA